MNQDFLADIFVNADAASDRLRREVMDRALPWDESLMVGARRALEHYLNLIQMRLMSEPCVLKPETCPLSLEKDVGQRAPESRAGQHSREWWDGVSPELTVSLDARIAEADFLAREAVRAFFQHAFYLDPHLAMNVTIEGRAKQHMISFSDIVSIETSARKAFIYGRLGVGASTYTDGLVRLTLDRDSIPVLTRVVP